MGQSCQEIRRLSEDSSEDMNYFAELLQISLGNRETLLGKPSEQDWNIIFAEAQRQGLVGVLACGVEKLLVDMRPPKDILLQWIGLLHMNGANYNLHSKRAKEITAFFSMAGYKSCILKGVGLAQLYPESDRRQVGDIDLWVNGDRREIINWLRGRYETSHMLWHHIDAKIFNDVSTEIHYHPCWLYNPVHNRRLQHWFDEKRNEQMRIDSNIGYAYPTVAFNAVYSMAHSYHHLIEEGLGLRHIIDYYYILIHLPVDEKETVVSLLKKFKMIHLAAAMMWVLKEICGMESKYMLCEPNEKKGRFLLDEVMRGGNFGHYRKDNRKRNTAYRMLALLPYYPSEVLWVVPWKLWHMCWRIVNR